MTTPRFTLPILACCVGLAGCGDDAEKGSDIAPSETIVREETGSATWIRRMDAVDPAVWLASQEKRRAVARDDPEVGRIRRAMDEAAPKFLEPRRMIANRTAQLAESLAQIGKRESAADLIVELSALVTPDHGKETYGDLCQFYMSLRRAGYTREDALERLDSPFRLKTGAGARDK
ncbi:hypothetical protein CCR94_03170 [Rhodoblastus sphagnicola]|uniref:MxaH protein n=1 Tax=Rhodoblastus sphagnicola TaxID=333368 RepID=A0A2S6NEF6_9HYPH|nr:hypothetical protein [Rhodoblastus sphagnicola]MBB4200165.1 hypothetical protein [Rhodoblastus sphagnicola]PPQ32991.1 hypothetical protein CCR94_03170 [Rhodoblastus sphagnicola]